MILGLSHLGGEIQSDGDHWRARLPLIDFKHRLHARLPGGGIVDELMIRWPKNYASTEFFSSSIPVEAQAEIRVIADDELLNAALSQLVQIEDDTSQNYLLTDSFLGKQLIEAVLNQL